MQRNKEKGKLGNQGKMWEIINTEEFGKWAKMRKTVKKGGKMGKMWKNTGKLGTMGKNVGKQGKKGNTGKL